MGPAVVGSAASDRGFDLGGVVTWRKGGSGPESWPTPKDRSWGKSAPEEMRPWPARTSGPSAEPGQGAWSRVSVATPRSRASWDWAEFRAASTGIWPAPVMVAVSSGSKSVTRSVRRS
jgi:hypothetical protein